jgi:glycosyltransferase involved in cell wall biosynthesis
MVALSFPPSAAPAAIPAAQLATFLPEHGWFPTILTIRENRLLMTHAAGQGQVLPSRGLAVRRTGIIYPPDRLTLPDVQCGWLPFAVAAGLAVARRRPVDCLYSIGPPMTAHLVGLALHRLLGRPWVADFHDPWLANPWRRGDRRWPFGALESWLERSVLQSAQRIVTKTPEMIDLLAARAGRPREDFLVAPCAYDAAEVEAARQEARRDPARLVLVHAGRFYGPRSPEPLLQAVAQVAADPAVRARLEVRLVGHADPETTALAQRLGIAELVHQFRVVSHHEALRHVLEADLAVVVQPGTGVQVPSKVYEYLGGGVPVLALTGEGATARIVREAKAGVVVAPDDVAGIAAAMRACFDHLAEHRSGRNQQYIGQFEARAVVGRVAALLDELSGRG